jgi:hypothetical protein
VEDEETIDSIMKKFQELEDIKSTLEPTDTLPQEALEEVFKRTSAFTVKSAQAQVYPDELNPYELQYALDDSDYEFHHDEYYTEWWMTHVVLTMKMTNTHGNGATRTSLQTRHDVNAHQPGNATQHVTSIRCCSGTNRCTSRTKKVTSLCSRSR